MICIKCIFYILCHFPFKCPVIFILCPYPYAHLNCTILKLRYKYVDWLSFKPENL